MTDSISSRWTCSQCTFVNINDEDSDHTGKCRICQGIRAIPSASTDDDSSASDGASDVATRGESLSDFNNRSIRWSELMPVSVPSKSNGEDSISALGHMSFAVWESDRKSWECKACTFFKGPRFLMCSACGMAEGGGNFSSRR